MITGQPPFAGPTLSVLQSHVTQDPTPIRELRPDCPDDLLGAVQRMLEKRIEDRWPTLSAAIAAANATPPGLDGPVREQLELFAAQAAGITVAEWASTMREGSREEIRVLVVDAGGRVLRGRRVEWNSLDPVVAGVSGHSIIRAFAPGATQMRATSGAASLTLPLMVESDPIRDIEVDPSDVTLPMGSQMKLEAVVHDWDGERLEDRAVLWSSSDSNIARVDFDGIVEAIMRGGAVISASTGGKAAAVNVTVSEATRARKPGTAAAARATIHPVPKPPSPPTLEPVGPTPPPAVPQETPVAVPGEARTRKALWIGAAAVVGITAVVLGITRPWQRAPTSVDGAPNPAGPQLAGSDSVPPPAAPPQVAVTTDTAQLSPPPAASAANTNQARVTSPPAAPRAESTRVPVTQTAEPEPEPPPVVRGTVEVAATNLPAGWSIIMSDPAGQATAVTARSLSLVPGTYVFEFRAPGHETDQQRITVSAGQTQRYSPDVRAVPSRQPPPARDARADQAAIETAVRDFIAAFQRRDASVVVPLLPSEQRTNWRTLLENRGVSDWQATLGTLQPARIDGDNATVQFTVRVSFRSMNQTPRQELRYTGSLERSGSAWRLASLRTN
jgi:hypothetical protein